MTQTQPAPSGAAVTSIPLHPGRAAAARTIIFAQAPICFLIGLLYLGRSAWTIAGLSIAGSAVLLWGALRMGHDAPPIRRLRSNGEWSVPWDWTDFLLFWPAAFTASTMLASLLVPAVDGLAGNADSTVRNAVESFVSQTAFYGGALFNIYVLAGLRRGGTLHDIGWRKFSWWWVLLAAPAWYVTLYLADLLQTLSQRLFPSAQNTQCTAVQHSYGHFLVLAVIVVCVIAPLSEETIFRGFFYGWLRRWSPVGLAVPLSAAIFAALHGVLLLFIPLFAVGCILAVLFQTSRSLWPGALVHAAFNLPGIIAILSATSC